MHATTTTATTLAVVFAFAGLGLLGEKHGHGVDARAGKKGAFPVMGWNTWCTQDKCGTDWCSSAEVLDVAEAIRESGMQGAGYDHILLDDCWGQRDNTTGEIIGDPYRFPEGMKAFISKLHDMGFKFGLYTDIGTRGCHHPFVGSFPYYARDAATFKEWNVDYVKFDGCDQPSGYTAEALTCNMSDALLSTGHDFWFNFHCWHNSACAKCGTSFRVGPDHHDVWSGSSSSTSSIIKEVLAKRQDWWGPDPEFGWPDADFIYTGGQGCNGTDPGPGPYPNPPYPGPSPAGQRCPGQTETEYMTEFSIWAIAGGQIVLASDPRNMSSFQKKVLLNTELIEVFNDTKSFRSTKIIGTGSSSCDSCQVWARPLSDGAAVIALYNSGEQEVDLSVSFSDIPDRQWTSDTTVDVRDLWEHANAGTAKGSFSAKVDKHATTVVKLTSS